MIKRLFLYLPRLLLPILIIITSLAAPLNVYAESCSLNGSSFNTGDTIQFTIGNIPSGRSTSYTAVLYQVGPTNTLGTFDISSPSVTIPNAIATGQYAVHLETISAGALQDVAVCTPNPITITNSGGGAPPTGPNCSIWPSTISVGQNISITSNNLTANSRYDVFLANSPSPSSSFPVGTTTSNLVYNFAPTQTSTSTNINVQIGRQGTTEKINCSGTFSFISVAAGNLKLIAPVSPITTTITTLPQLILENPDFVVGQLYVVELSGMWDLSAGGVLKPPGSSNGTWSIDSTKRITASNICENGESGRTNCTDNFRVGTYIMVVKNFNSGANAGSASFIVQSPSGGGTTGPAGQNPCAGGATGSCNTAIGSIPTNPTAFVGKILTIAISLAGAIALIIMVIGSIKVLMSAGDQQRLANGRDMIIGAIAGLLFLIFSVLILRYLGSDLFGFFTVT